MTAASFGQDEARTRQGDDAMGVSQSPGTSATRPRRAGPSLTIFSAASDRPLGLRARPDLVIVPQSYGSVRYWLVKDPLSLKYFHLGDEEHAVLTMLDGQASLRELQERFQRQFAPRQIGLEQLHAFVGHLHASGLVVGSAPGQGLALHRRRVERRRKAWAETLLNLLAIRFRGIDPEPMLAWLSPRCVWIFSGWFLAMGAAVVLAAVVLAAVQFDALARRFEQAPAFWTAGNLPWLAVALVLVKCVHELGHALTCKHFGGECHEIGLLLLVGTPCLYCDVSDAWLLPNKWHRVAISAAGILVELFLAAVALMLWWFSEPGPWNTLLLNIVVLCSVNTVFLNGNPLLRYDGYFVLADALEIPNLSQHGRALVNRLLGRCVLGIDPPEDRYLPRRLRLFTAAYGLASTAYRWLVVVAILWMLHHLLKPHGFQVVAALLATVVLGGMIAAPAVRFGAWLSRPGGREPIRSGRAVLGATACLAAAVIGLLVPLPMRVRAPLVIQPQDGHSVYVLAPGRLTEAVDAGIQVAQDQVLARLANAEIDRELAELSGQREQQRRRLEHLRLRLPADPSLAPQIPPAEEALADLEARWRQRELDRERLVLRSPAAGTVIPPPHVPPTPLQRGSLGIWQGGLLEPRNRGAFLERGAMLCQIADPARLEASLVVDQADVPLVQLGQSVRLKLDSQPGRVLWGTVVEVARTDLKVAPRELAASGDLPIHRDRSGTPRLAVPSYQVRVALEAVPPGLLPGARGQAKIVVSPRSLGARLIRAFSQAFRFHL